MPSPNRKRKEPFKLGSSTDQRKIEFVKKSKVSNDKKSEEVSFLFIYYYFKPSQLKTLDTYTYLGKYILSY